MQAENDSGFVKAYWVTDKSGSEVLDWIESNMPEFYEKSERDVFPPERSPAGIIHEFSLEDQALTLNYSSHDTIPNQLSVSYSEEMSDFPADLYQETASEDEPNLGSVKQILGRCPTYSPSATL